MKKVVLLILACLCFVIAGCTMEFDENGGELITNITALPEPKNIEYVDETNTVTWAQVDNASGYYVQINDENPIGVLSSTQYVIPTGKFSENCTFTVRVKACGNGVYYSDSVWCSALNSFNYTVKTAVDYSNEYYDLGLGRSINFITASSYEPEPGAKSIFDKNKLKTKKPMAFQTLQSYGKEVSANTYDDFIKRISVNTNLKMSRASKESVGFDDLFFFGAYISSNLETNTAYESKYASQTSQYYYHKEHVIKTKTLSLPEYNDTRIYSDMLSESFLADAESVNSGELSPAQFINMYGTHVMMGINLGGILYVDYQEFAERNEQNEERQGNIMAGISAGVSAGISLDGVNVGGGSSGSSEISADVKGMNSQINSSMASSFNVRSLGGASQDICNSMLDFMNSYKGWAGTVDDGMYTIIDVPNSSLFCVWDYLDDEKFANAKMVLNTYVKEQCKEQESAFRDKFAQYILPGNITYDYDTKTLVIDMSSIQQGDNPNATREVMFDGFKNGELIITPQKNSQEIHKVHIKGNYRNRSTSGELIKSLIENFRIKFDDDWYRDFELILENVGLARKDINPLLDLKLGERNCKVTITLIGENYLDGGSYLANSNDAQATMIAKDIIIRGNGALTVIGSNGEKNGVNGTVAVNANSVEIANDKLFIEEINILNDSAKHNVNFKGGNGADGVSPTNYSGNGSNGGNGAIGIVANNIIVKSGTIYVSGGNGGIGGNGHDGYSYSYVGNLKATHSGGNGGNGGNGGLGACAISCNQFEVATNVIINLKSGDGGNGGKAGNGGTGSSTGEWNHRGGNGGNGGTGGNGGDSCFAYITTKNAINGEIIIENSNAGNGGCFGEKGGAGCGKTAPKHFPWTASTVDAWWGTDGVRGNNGIQGLINVKKN